MSKINIYCHRETNTWWTDSDLKDIELANYLDKNGFGLGAVLTDRNNGLNKMPNTIVPDAAKFLSGFRDPEDIKKNGTKVTQDELKEILDNTN